MKNTLISFQNYKHFRLPITTNPLDYGKLILKRNDLKLLNKEYDEKSKCTVLTFENNFLLDHKNLFVALFAGLILQSEFKKIGKKIMIVSIFSENKTFFIHRNIIIDENTTIFIYLNKIKHNIQTFYDSGYPLTAFQILQIKL